MVSASFNSVTNGGGDVGEHGEVASCRVAQHTGTHRSKRLPARGCTSENDIWVVILENAEKSLKRRLVTETTGKPESKIMSVRVLWCLYPCWLCSNLHLLDSEWLHMLSAGNQ